MSELEKERTLDQVTQYAAGQRRAVYFILINTTQGSSEQVSVVVANMSDEGVRWTAEITGIADVIAAVVNPSGSTLTIVDHLSNLQAGISAIPEVTGLTTLQVAGGEYCGKKIYPTPTAASLAWRAQNGWP